LTAGTYPSLRGAHDQRRSAEHGNIKILRDDVGGLLVSAGQPGATYLFDDTITAMERDDAGLPSPSNERRLGPFDFVSGADGLHSNARHFVFGDD
jgi:2-polyprenyl-6-methoxyphenol hydroxylase-like FAD-dependent oxidoreductase